jgi:hypothetical protein
MTNEEKTKQLIQDAIDRDELARLPGGFIIETSKLTDEHRTELCANSTDQVDKGETNEGTMIGSPVDLSHAKFVEIKITKDCVWVNTERGLMFRAYRVGKIVVTDERE